VASRLSGQLSVHFSTTKPTQ